MQVQLRTDDDDRTARVVHTLAEQVLTETSLLALEHVRQRLQRAVARSGHRTSATAVVEQRVHGLLQHPLLVVDDDLGSTEVEQTLETVVAVDHATVEVVEVRGREATAVELDHRTQLRRNHRHDVEDHALGVVVGGQERVDDLEALERTGLALALAGGDELTQLLGFGFEVEVHQALLDRLGAHRSGEVEAEAMEHLAVQALVALEVVDLEVLEPIPHLLDAVDLTVGVAAQLVHFLLGGIAQLLLGLGGSAVGLECGEILFELLGTTVDIGVPAGADLLLLDVDLVLQAGQIPVTGVLVDRGDHVGREVDDLLEVLRGQVQQVSQTGGNTLEVPDVGHGSGQFDVAHALTAHLGPGDLDAAAFADDALEADALVLAARALPVAGGSEDLLAEESVLLRLQGPVVDGLRLFHLTV